MAMLPCSHCGMPPRGRNANFYVSIGAAADFSRYRIRLCRRHLAVTEEHLAEFEIDTEDAALGWNGGAPKCVADGQPASEVDWQVFVTGYPADQQRKDYWGRLHVNCNIPDWLAERPELPPPVGADRPLPRPAPMPEAQAIPRRSGPAA